MIPIMLDAARLRVGLAGRGALAVRRLEWFRRLGAAPELFSDAPGGELIAVAGDMLIPRLPDAGDLAALDLLWIADIDPGAAADLYGLARAAKTLVNVEDDLPLCDFHTPSVVTRGALVIAAGTGGGSPALAAIVRERLEEAFPVAWGPALDDIAAARRQMRSAGAAPAEIAADARRRLAETKLI